MFTKSFKSNIILRFFALVTILCSLIGASSISDVRAQSGTVEDGYTSVSSPILQPMDPEQLLLPNILPADMATLLSTDTRVRVTPTSSAPWQYIARILFTYPDDSAKICTGFFIGPYTVATAGHCVHDMTRVKKPDGVNGWAVSATVYPGYDAGVVPFGSASGYQLYSTQGWIEGQDQQYDYGAVYLTSPLGDTVGYFNFGFFSDEYLIQYFSSGGVAGVAGYPLDKDAACPGGNPAGCLWTDSGPVTSMTSKILNYSISTDTAGQDGAPIWINDSGNLYAVGINLFSAGDSLCSAGKNCGLRIISEVAANFETWSNRMPLTDPMGAGVYDDTSPSWWYSGTWVKYSGSGPYLNTMHYTNSADGKAAFRFNGVQFILTYAGYSNRGSFEVWVDDVLVTTVNAYSASLTWQRTYTSPVYDSKEHTVVIKNTNTPAGSYIDIDAIRIIAPMGAGVYDDTHKAWMYSGAWTAYSGAGPYSNTLRYTKSVGAAATFVFNGVQFILKYAAYSNRGSFEVWVDGALVTTVNAYSASLAWQRTYTSPVFALGVHRVEFKNVGPVGTYTDIDAIQIIVPVDAGIYDDAHTAWTYSGAWTAYSGAGPYSNTMHYTNTVGAAATFAFNGIQFVLSYTVHPNRGSFEVWVDGALVTTVNAYGAGLVWQQKYVSPIYAAGIHTVVIKNTNTPTGSYIDIDAIQILSSADTLAPDAVGLLSATSGIANGSIDLSWTSPLQDAGISASGSVVTYQVRYSRSNITTGSDWDAATPVTTGIPAPAAPGVSQTMTVGGLIPGLVYYVAVRGQDIGFNLGPIAAIAVTSRSPAPASAGVYDDTSAFWVYTGTWVAYSGAGPYSNTMRYTKSAGAGATFVFNGNQFVLTYAGYTNRGSFEVWVDGVLVTTVNAYNASLVWQRTYTSPVFTLGVHTVEIKNTNTPAGSYIDVDAIRIIAPLGAGVYDDAHAAWTYSGAWTAYSGAGPYSNTMHYTNSVGASATFMFNGTQFVLTYTAHPNRGSFEVWVDGALVTTVNAYSASLTWQRTYTSPVFSLGVHTVEIKNTNTPAGSYIDVDAIQIIAPIGAGVYDDTHTAWTYSGVWTAYSGAGPYANTLHYTNNMGASATFVFNGSQFVLTYTAHPNRGSFEVWVDGVLVTTVNAYSASLIWQRTYTSPVYSAGIHTVEVKYAGSAGMYTDTDAIWILP
jgi:glutamyl endopeptidase